MSIPVSLGEVLNLDDQTLAADVYAYGKVVGGSFGKVALKGKVTFANGASPHITIIVETDADASLGYGFSGVETKRQDTIAPGFAVTHSFDPSDGAEQVFWIQGSGADLGARFRVGALSVGAPGAAGDTVKLEGFGSVD